MSQAPGFADPAGTWNQRFGADGYLFGTAPNAWLREHAGVWSAGERVLCVADGEGRRSAWPARRGLQVEAFDIAEVGVAKARQLDWRTGGPPLASHLYTAELLREAFAAMDIVELRDYEADLAEGSGHRGHSALIGLVARRR